MLTLEQLKKISMTSHPNRKENFATLAGQRWV
jgi:hypothetical protein